MKLFSWGITTREIAIKQKTQHGSINFALKGLSFYDQGLHLKNCTRMAGPGGGGRGVGGVGAAGKPDLFCFSTSRNLVTENISATLRIPLKLKIVMATNLIVGFLFWSCLLFNFLFSYKMVFNKGQI